MTRSQTSHGGEGPTRGTGPLAGSLSGFDHRAHRKELFGEWGREARNGDMGEARKSGCHVATAETAREVYLRRHRDDETYTSIAEDYPFSHRTVADIAKRRTWEDETADLAEAMGYPEREDRRGARQGGN